MKQHEEHEADFEEFTEPIVMDCDFCKEVEHYRSRRDAIEDGWYWSVQNLKDGTQIKTSSCEDCGKEKLSERSKHKLENIDFKGELD